MRASCSFAFLLGLMLAMAGPVLADVPDTDAQAEVASMATVENVDHVDTLQAEQAMQLDQPDEVLAVAIPEVLKQTDDGGQTALESVATLQPVQPDPNDVPFIPAPTGQLAALADHPQLLNRGVPVRAGVMEAPNPGQLQTSTANFDNDFRRGVTIARGGVLAD